MSCTNPFITYGTQKGLQAEKRTFYNKKQWIEFINENYNGDYMLPCRKCLSCKMENARQWALRSQLEIESNPGNNWFITLTYNNQNVPMNKNNSLTLKDDDLSNFINTLRVSMFRKKKKKFKYLAGSEYGSRTFRPHYHLCIFSLELDDLVPTGKKNDMGQPYFSSKYIEQIWGKGNVIIGEVNYESAGYVARYTFKKQTKMDYKKLEIEPEKLRMSKGIGQKYFEDNYEHIYDYDNLYVQAGGKVKNSPPPRYYDRLLEKVNPLMLEMVKADRVKKAKLLNTTKVESTGLTYFQLLDNRKTMLLEKSRSLKRNLKNKK